MVSISQPWDFGGNTHCFRYPETSEPVLRRDRVKRLLKKLGSKGGRPSCSGSFFCRVKWSEIDRTIGKCG